MIDPLPYTPYREDMLRQSRECDILTAREEARRQGIVLGWDGQVIKDRRVKPDPEPETNDEQK